MKRKFFKAKSCVEKNEISELFVVFVDKFCSGLHLVFKYKKKLIYSIPLPALKFKIIIQILS